MRWTFASLDDVLIERVFQPVADWISFQIGMPRARAACCCIDAASLAWIVSRVSGVSDAFAAREAATAFLGLILLLLGLAALISLRIMFRRVTTKQKANPLRRAMQPHRAILLLMLAARIVQMHAGGMIMQMYAGGLIAQMHAVGLADAADLAMLICAAAALYLGACMERPPISRGLPSPASSPA